MIDNHVFVVVLLTERNMDTKDVNESCSICSEYKCYIHILVCSRIHLNVDGRWYSVSYRDAGKINIFDILIYNCLKSNVLS